MSRSETLNLSQLSLPEIAPSMLKCDFGNLHREVELLEAAGAKILHWDVMDGHFVPNLSYGAMLIEKVRPRTGMIFDTHLMISHPESYIDDFLRAGSDWITIHVEASPAPGEILQRIRSGGARAGLAINPGTPLETVEPYLEACDQILVMSVEPGFGGQTFLPEVLPKLEQLRQLRSEKTLLSIDGGIGPATIAQAASAGAEVFVVGSALFDTDDYAAAISELLAAASIIQSSASG